MNIKETIDYIQKEIGKLPKKKMGQKEIDFVQRYLGSSKKIYGAKTADVLKIARIIVKEQDNIDAKDIIELLNRLFAADNFEEYVVGGKIFTLLKPQNRSKISFEVLESWLSKAKGWVEVDVICQSTFTGQEVLGRWQQWERTIKKFRQSEIISLRRASLVLQCKPTKEAGDAKLRKLAFDTIEELKFEKDVLITRAISWLLRSLTVQDKAEIRAYILKNETTLPRIAVREALKKNETGKK